MKKRNQKGFTLAELLIVVAIIAVLVAIAIPIFTTQLEKSKEGTDIANLRSAYAAGQVAALTGQYGETTFDTSATTSLQYNPNKDGSLDSSGTPIGKGTVKDGKSDVSAFNGGPIKYTTATEASGKAIDVVIASGVVSVVGFNGEY